MNLSEQTSSPPPTTALSPLAKCAAVVRYVNGLLLTILAFLLVLFVVWQVLSRYISPKPSTVTDELARFAFMWIGLLGAAQATAYKQHLAIDLLQMKLKGQAKRGLNILIECIIIAFAALAMVWGGMLLTMNTFAHHQITPALQWPMGYIYMVVPIAGVMIIFFALDAIFTPSYPEE
ncbi:MAG: TRAP transporter small permease [Cardiobacteriaceae bacterium]|nr:TRAP transporter small permease [Cardiobacteriaceae bacterium]